MLQQFLSGPHVIALLGYNTWSIQRKKHNKSPRLARVCARIVVGESSATSFSTLCFFWLSARGKQFSARRYKKAKWWKCKTTTPNRSLPKQHVWWSEGTLLKSKRYAAHQAAWQEPSPWWFLSLAVPPAPPPPPTSKKKKKKASSSEAWSKQQHLHLATASYEGQRGTRISGWLIHKPSLPAFHLLSNPSSPQPAHQTNAFDIYTAFNTSETGDLFRQRPWLEPGLDLG